MNSQFDQEVHNFHQKTDEVIDRFTNGREKYMRSALFNRVVQMMVRGESTYDIIEHLIQVTEDTQAAFSEFVIRDTRPTVINARP